VTRIDSIAALEALYDAPAQRSLTKVTPTLTPHYRRWIDASRFCVLATVGPEGTDASPRGDDGPVVRIADDRTILMPDWRGNNRIDTLRNIVRDGRVSLMFMITGSNTVIRVNGRADLTADEPVTGQFRKNDKSPRVVIVVTATEVYFQCAKALMRADLWARTGDADALPTAGDFLSEREAGFDAESYDANYADYARDSFGRAPSGGEPL
jgi:PPOX class probable FMN-dependent enzyme